MFGRIQALTLKTHSGVAVSGTDSLGSFKRVDFEWAAVSVEFATSVRAYDSGVVVFAQNFSTGLTADGRLGTDSPLSWWPAFDHAETAPELGYLGFSGCMSGGADVGPFRPAPPATEAMEETAPAPAPSNLSLKPCKAGVAAQEWTFLADAGETDAAACREGAAGSDKNAQRTHHEA